MPMDSSSSVDCEAVDESEGSKANGGSSKPTEEVVRED